MPKIARAVGVHTFRRDSVRFFCQKLVVPARRQNTITEGVTVVDHPLVRVKLTKLRDEKTPSEEFRQNLRGLAMLMLFEASRDFETVAADVRTPLAPCAGSALARPVIVAPILRAGTGMADGF